MDSGVKLAYTYMLGAKYGDFIEATAESEYARFHQNGKLMLKMPTVDIVVRYDDNTTRTCVLLPSEDVMDSMMEHLSDE